MDRNTHISHDEIFPLSSKNRAIRGHLEACEQCGELANLLGHASKKARELRPDDERSHPSTMQLSETMAKIYENSMSPQEAANFIHHLKSCSQCFNYVALEVEESLSEISEKVLEELEAYSGISLVEKVLPDLPEEEPSLKKSAERKRHAVNIPNLPVSVPWVHKLEKVLVPQLGYALIFLMALGGGFGGYRYYVTIHKINSAADLLTENHRIYMADTPRLSGGYASTGIGLLMVGEKSTEELSYLTQAFSLTEEAIEKGSKSPKAKQLQAHIFIIQKDYHKADSVLTLLREKDKRLAPVLNDLGVLKYKQEEWQQAMEYFKAAIQIRPDFTESYYNLALAQSKLDKKEEARSTLEVYLEFKNDIGWKNAALNFLNELKKNNE